MTNLDLKITVNKQIRCGSQRYKDWHYLLLMKTGNRSPALCGAARAMTESSSIIATPKSGRLCQLLILKSMLKIWIWKAISTKALKSASKAISPQGGWHVWSSRTHALRHCTTMMIRDIAWPDHRWSRQLTPDAPGASERPSTFMSRAFPGWSDRKLLR